MSSVPPSPSSRPSLAIMGTPVSSGNRGVLALGASLINLCAQARPGAEIVLLLGHRDTTPVSFRVAGQARLIPITNCRLSPRSHPRDHFFVIVACSFLYRLLPPLRRFLARRIPWIKTVAAADFVGNVHGGDSFSDIYGLKGYVLSFLADWSVILVKGSLVQFPQTYGPYKSGIARFLARFLLRRSSLIIARDKQSRQVAESLIGPGQEVLLSPDVAFSLESILQETVETDPPPARPIPPGTIGLNVNGLMYNGGYTRSNMFGLQLDYPAYLTQAATSLLREHPGELWLVPHTFAAPGNVESDQDACLKLRDSLPLELRGRVRIVTREYDQYEIKGVIRQFDFFIGSRMHACIAALSQGVPCVGVAYSMKFAGVFESVGVRDWVIDGRDTATEAAVARTLELFRLRGQTRAPLTAAGHAARQQLTAVFAKLAEGKVER